ncbi:MAG: DEAD/DEAH box helicase [Nitrososphaera sp.]
MAGNYRCPRCSAPHSVSAERIFDGRVIVRCSKCSVCALVPWQGGSDGSQPFDEAYLEFLDRVDAGSGISSGEDLDIVMEQERIIRTRSEIEKMISGAGATGDPLVRAALESRQDYVVDFRALEEPAPELGGRLEELPIDPALIGALKSRGIDRLFKFQEMAVKSILQGKDVVITAPTASGKTEAFTIPILQSISEQVPRFGSLRPTEGGRISAIFVYPTKALSRDQLPKIRGLADSLGLRVAVLDGDTKDAERAQVMGSPPDVLITNFDVIHYHLLHRTKLSRLLRTARFLVVDEAHVYTGVFGSNVHHIVARLERTMDALSGRKRLQVAAASATLPNAGQFCEVLFGRPLQVIEGSGRQQNIKMAMIFPSLRSHRSLVLDLIRQAARNHHRTLSFSNSHLGAELTAFYSSRQGVSIRVHRAGLAAHLRRHVEDQFKAGKLTAISATPTLELGIDIGDIDVIVSGIVPVNRLTQRIGRAGRRGQQGYAFLALGTDPISQYYKNHPDDYLSDREYAYADPSNPFVLEYQVLAMSCDRPISMAESKPVWQTLQSLVSKGLITLEAGKFVPDREKAREVLSKYSIRGIGSRVDIMLNKSVIGDRALPQALEELHKDAVYFFSGRRYRVKQLHFSSSATAADQNTKDRQPYAELEPLPYDYPYYTKAITDEWPSVKEVLEKRQAFGVEVLYCTLHIRKRVLGYANIEIGQEAAAQAKRKVMLEEPLEFEFESKGFVFRAPAPTETISKSDSPEGPEYVSTSAFHATEHVVIEGSAMITGGASQDLGGISLGSSGLIFVYDGSIGGNGASRILFERLDMALGRALRILSDCPCVSESGCPRCTYSYRCGNNNEYLHKRAAIEVLSRIVEGEKTVVGEVIDGDRALV